MIAVLDFFYASVKITFINMVTLNGKLSASNVEN